MIYSHHTDEICGLESAKLPTTWVFPMFTIFHAFSVGKPAYHPGHTGKLNFTTAKTPMAAPMGRKK